MEDDSDIELSDNDLNETTHQQLVDNVLNLNKKQPVKQPSRTEPGREVSEFNLLTDSKGTVHVNDLTDVLTKRKKHLNITRIVKEKKNKLKTLPAPLPTPLAKQIRRVLNYEKERLQLDRWEGMVTANRVAPQVIFPLGSVEKVKVIEKASQNYPSTFRVKSELEKKLEALEPKNKTEEPTEEEKTTKIYHLTLQELREKRKEAAKLRAHLSFKEAKARQRNKIKSKKYHRMLKREKIKKQLKEFEELQKTDPEEALKKLEDIEKTRAHERFSLRHKGMGQWAKNKQIRAKYDKEARQALAEQLSIGRELTQKSKRGLNDSDEENDNEENKVKPQIDENNPWVNGIKPEQEVAEFLSGYRKFWENQNQEKTTIEEKETNGIKNVDSNNSSEKTSEINKINKDEIIEKESPMEQKKGKKIGNKNKLENKKKESLKNKKENLEWEVSALDEDLNLDNMFQQLEYKVHKKLKMGTEKVKEISKSKTVDHKEKVKKPTRKVDLTMPSRSKKQIIDEEMLERPKKNESKGEENAGIGHLKNILNTVKNTENAQNINPTNFINTQTTVLNTEIPDILTTEENEETPNQRDLITEAFEDDDIVEDFKAEKTKAIEEDTPKDIDLSLPGWGQWAGANIKPKKRKRKHLILKMPKEMPRKDANKGSLIINPKAESKIKPLLVNEVPFPFKSVADYEASIRAPIGNTFVPQRAFKKLIEPAVTTKMGKIIEPITKDILVSKKN